jgi:hypothetical protein
MQLRVTDGTTTVDLSGGKTGISGCTYFPLAPNAGEGTVAEQAELVCKGAPAATIRSALNTLERLCEAARRRHATGKGVKVYVEYKPVDSDSLYRSELHEGRLVYSEEPGARRFGDANPAILVAFTFERAPWWEGPEVELAISSQGYAAATGGRRITNNGISNWVQVTGGLVAGTEPGPVRLQLTNDTGSSQDYRHFFVGLNAFASPTSFNGLHQGEADTLGTGSVAYAGASNGYYRNFNVSSSEQLVASWLLTVPEMTSGGRWCRLLARFTGYVASHNIRVRPVIRDYYGLVTLWEGQQIWLPTIGAFELLDLGSVPIPPGAYSDEYAQCSLGLQMKADAATTVSIDYIQLVPMDGYKAVEQVGYQVPAGGAVEVNEMDDSVYYWSGNQRWPLHVATGPGLRLWPNTTQRLYILHDEGWTSPVANTLSVRLWHRPRRTVV